MWSKPIKSSEEAEKTKTRDKQQNQPQEIQIAYMTYKFVRDYFKLFGYNFVENNKKNVKW